MSSVSAKFSGIKIFRIRCAGGLRRGIRHFAAARGRAEIRIFFHGTLKFCGIGL
jgi:hypothetical protein